MRLPSLQCATPLFAFRPEFLARLTVQAFGVGLIRARLRDCLFIRGAGHRGRCRRRWSLRRRDGGGDDERQDGRAKCHRSHGVSSRAMKPRRFMGFPEGKDHGRSIAGQAGASCKNGPFMSALGVISNHHPVNRRCPLYPRKPTSSDATGMSALCRKRTLVRQEKKMMPSSACAQA